MSATAVTTRKDFVLGTNSLKIAFENQAGTAEKALSEIVQNGVDALAKEVHVRITSIDFEVDDNGHGFKDEQSVRDYFQKVSFDHNTELHSREGYVGTHGMGRLQTMVLSAASWRTNTFLMETDVLNKGLTFDLSTGKEFRQGCLVSGDWYEPLNHAELMETVKDLSARFQYCETADIYINGKKVNCLPMGKPDIENSDFKFWYQAEADTLSIINCGTFVVGKALPYTGIFISKKALTLNTARTSIMENECLVWRSAERVISRWFKTQVFERLAVKQKADDRDMQFVLSGLKDGKIKPNEVRDLYFIPSIKKRPSISPNELEESDVKVFWGQLSTITKKDTEGVEAVSGKEALEAAMLMYSEQYWMVTESKMDRFFSLVDSEPNYELIQVFKKESEPSEKKKTKKPKKLVLLTKDKMSPYQIPLHDPLVNFVSGIIGLIPNAIPRDVKFVRNISMVSDDAYFTMDHVAVDGESIYIGTSSDLFSKAPTLAVFEREIYALTAMLMIQDDDDVTPSGDMDEKLASNLFELISDKGFEFGRLIKSVTIESQEAMVESPKVNVSSKLRSNLTALKGYDLALEIYTNNLEK